MSLAINTSSCFLWSHKLALFIFFKESHKLASFIFFKENVTKYLRLNNHLNLFLNFVWKSFFQTKMSVKKVISSAYKSNDHTSALPEDNHHTWVCGWSTLCVLPIWSDRILKSFALKRHDLTKLISFAIWSRIFLSENGIIF